MKEKILITIAGGTASGKSLFAKFAEEELKRRGNKVALINLDNYYKTLDQLKVATHAEVNWDHPDTFDWERLISDVKDLKAGKSISTKEYNYGTGFYHDDEIITEPEDYIIIEGIFSLQNEDLNKLSDLRIFIDADEEVRKQRRIKRDSEGRYAHNFNIDNFNKLWENLIQPMHIEYIQPTKIGAKVIKNNGNDATTKKEELFLLFD